jgi:hypothetical protein
MFATVNPALGPPRLGSGPSLTNSNFLENTLAEYGEDLQDLH